MEEKIIKRNRGFTLVELIVVIAIIGILAAVLVPSLTSYIGKTKNAVCENNIQQCNRSMQYSSIYENFSTQESFLAKIVETVGGKAEYDSDLGYAYVSGLCPFGGKYYLVAAENDENLTEWEPHFIVHCTHHNKDEGKISFDPTKSFTITQFDSIFKNTNGNTAISQLLDFINKGTSTSLDSSESLGLEIKTAIGLQFNIPVGYPFDYKIDKEIKVAGIKDGKAINGTAYKMYIHFGKLPTVENVVTAYCKETGFNYKTVYNSINLPRKTGIGEAKKYVSTQSNMTIDGTAAFNNSVSTRYALTNGNILNYRYGKENYNGYKLLGYKYIIWDDGKSDLLLGKVQTTSVSIAMGQTTNANGEEISFPHVILSTDEYIQDEFKYGDNSLNGKYYWGEKSENIYNSSAANYVPCYANLPTNYLDNSAYIAPINSTLCSGAIENITD